MEGLGLSQFFDLESGLCSRYSYFPIRTAGSGAAQYDFDNITVKQLVQYFY
jgi:hypothetical protein